MAEYPATATIRRFLEAASVALDAAREHLHELDAALGDGDHGDAITAGFAAASHAAASATTERPGTVLQQAGRALADQMGGAAGPLYATVLRGLADGLGDAEELELNDLAAGARRAADTVARRGRVSHGDGSLLDALEPFAACLDEHASSDSSLAVALADAADAADRGALATTDRPKRRGRASSHPSQGVGAQDPGARSLAIVVRALANALADHATSTPERPPLRESHP